MFSRKNPFPALEQELKFHIPRQASPRVLQWMRRTFRSHASHAVSTICSIYFDTRAGSSFREKEASDFRKTKYRVRWYADEAGRPCDGPAFLEIKEKHGAGRRKVRVALEVPAAEIAAAPLTDPLFGRLFAKCPEAAEARKMELGPVLELRYRRHRYTHPVYRETFCLDTDIRCERTHAGCLPAARGVTLEHDIFEQKGAAPQPLPVLQALPRFNARRAALSKYFLMILQLQPESAFA